MQKLSIDEACARMLGQVRPLGRETVAIEDALGRVLAEPVDADRDQPPFDSSAMDGWAMRAADAEGPALLDIVGESAAGRGYDGVVEPGQAVRVFTGAPMPTGADAVVIQEEAARQGHRVRVAPARRGQNVRSRGGDFQAGARLLEPGQGLDAWRLSLAAAAGRGELTVARRPRVAVLATGEELVRPPRRPNPWQIYESGSIALCALTQSWGGAPQRLAPARDTEDAVVEAVEGRDADLIVTIGGASVGDYDVVKPALSRLGLEMFVPSVNIRPGKPTWFGRLGDGRPVLGLPGNPASALVCAELFLRPLLRAMLGADPAPRFVKARLAGSLRANGERTHLMRARLQDGPDGVLEVVPLKDQDSSLVTVFAQADALLRQPANAPAAAPGEMVEVLRLERLA